MYSEERLPKNGKEFALFLCVVSIISVNIIAPVIMGFEFGFRREVYFNTLHVIPVMWVVVVLSVTMVARPLVGKLTVRFTAPTDGFNARVLFNVLFSVTILSILLTIIGTWIGKREFDMEPVQNLFYHWPRNFFIAFWVEILIAQPAARLVMRKLHQRQARKAERENGLEIVPEIILSEE